MRIQRNDGSGAGDTSRRVYHAKPQMQPEVPAPQSRPEEEADEYDAEDDGDERPRRRFPVGLVIVLVFAVLVAVGGWKGMQLYGELAGSGDSVIGEAVRGCQRQQHRRPAGGKRRHPKWLAVQAVCPLQRQGKRPAARPGGTARRHEL